MENRYLKKGTILQGKYLVERVLGEGGFGITYLAQDLNLERYVAIKEYCPREFASRSSEDGMTIRPFNDEESQLVFEREKEKYIEEARRLAKFYDLPGVVSVLDFFNDYGTAYLVMDYIDGETLSQYMKRNQGPMSVRMTLRLMKPVMESLAVMHKAGIVHRDISPDNIMINKSLDKVFLIDFGTARSTDIESNRSLSVYKKGGFTPLEQQSSHGNQGPWTDVYELCATIYKCITGHVPQEAVDRVVEDELLRPSECGALINGTTEQVIMDGLAIRVKDRIQSMDELARRLKEADDELNQWPVPEQGPVVTSVTMPVKAEPKPLPKVEPKAEEKPRISPREVENFLYRQCEIWREVTQKSLIWSTIIAFPFIGGGVGLLIYAVLYGTLNSVIGASIVFFVLILLCFAVGGTCVNSIQRPYLDQLQMCFLRNIAPTNVTELQVLAEIELMKRGRVRIQKSFYQIQYGKVNVAHNYETTRQYFYSSLSVADNISEEIKREWEKIAREKGILR